MVTATLEQRVLSSGIVQDAIGTVARRESRGFNYDEANSRVSSDAAELLGNMKAELNPLALSIGRLWALGNVSLSFAGVEIKGFERVKPLLKDGSAVVVSTHFSYFDLATLFHVLTGHGRTYYIGGENVTSPPNEDLSPWQNLKIEFVRWQFNNVGLIRINRGMAKDNWLQSQVLLSYLKGLLEEGNNIAIFSGAGRYKTGEIQPFDTILHRVFLPSAKFIVPVGITYGIVPEDYRFATDTDVKQASVHTAIGLQRKDRAYGPIYVNFGEPIPTASYKPLALANGKLPKPVAAKFQKDVTDALLRLATLTPVNVFALVAFEALAGDYDRPIRIRELTRPAQLVVSESGSKGVNVSGDLLHDSGSQLEMALQRAADALVWRGGLTPSNGFYGVAEPRLLEYYARHPRQSLEAAGVR